VRPCRHGRTVPPLPGARNRGKAIPVDPELPASFYAAIGRRIVGGLALRPDRLERLAAAARSRARNGRFTLDPELAGLGGIAPDALRGVLLALGYRAVIDNDREFFGARSRRRTVPQHLRAGPRPREDHPFAKLKELRFA
jgi:ATP-dependent RNA helicase SUPV3L1/SUV3